MLLENYIKKERKYAENMLLSSSREDIKKLAEQDLHDLDILEKFFNENDSHKDFHKNQNLVFKNLKNLKKEERPRIKYEIHKSTSHNRRQSSVYSIGIINGCPAYIRISNHWGCFSSNVINKNHPDADEFGRVGKKINKWDLEDADLTKSGKLANISQAGYIFF